MVDRCLIHIFTLGLNELILTGKFDVLLTIDLFLTLNFASGWASNLKPSVLLQKTDRCIASGNLHFLGQLAPKYRIHTSRRTETR